MGFVDKIKSYFVQENTIIKYTEAQVFESFEGTYNDISTIARCVDLICNTSASVPYKIVEDKGLYNVDVTHPRFEKLLENPSPDIGRYDFFRTCFRDLTYSGDSFLYNLGDQLQHLEQVEYTPLNTIRSGTTTLKEERLVHTKLIREVGYKFGTPYLSRIERELDLIAAMLNFQKNHFRSGAIPGVVLSSDNPLSKTQKERIAEEFLNMYSIMKGNCTRPFISDNGLKFDSIVHSFKELQFNEGVTSTKTDIASSLGIPNVLLLSGNNANILPNYKLFVYNTIAPFVDNMASELTLHLHRFYDRTSKLKVVADIEQLPLLQDDKVKTNNSIKTLVTTGLITINEGRSALRLPPSDEEIADRLLPPANITGSLFNESPGNPTDEE